MKFDFSGLVKFEWDRGNFNKNWMKHSVSDKECEQIFFNDPLIIFPDEKHSKKEERFGAFGITNLERKLTVFYTKRGDMVRVISARDQSKRERDFFKKEVLKNL